MGYRNELGCYPTVFSEIRELDGDEIIIRIQYARALAAVRNADARLPTEGENHFEDKQAPVRTDQDKTPKTLSNGQNPSKQEIRPRLQFSSSTR